MNAREILHQFAISYRVESRETRKKDIDSCLAYFAEMVRGEKRPYEISDPAELHQHKQSWNCTIDYIAKLFESKEG